MEFRQTAIRRAWLTLMTGAGLMHFAVPALANSGGGGGSQTCTARAQVNMASVLMPDFVKDANGAWVPSRVEINGTASQPKLNEGGSYLWSFSGSVLGTLSNATTTKATINAPDVTGASQQTVVRLTVSSPTCGTHFVDVPVTITNAHDVVQNTAPRARPTASPTRATEGTEVTLDGSTSSDLENDALSYVWTQTDGPAVTLGATDHPARRTFIAPNFTSDTPLTFRLTVSDGKLTGTDVTYVTVGWTNDAPTAALQCPTGAINVDEGGQVFVDGRASSDPDDGIASYAWQQLVGLPALPDLGTGSTTTFTAPALGYQQTGFIPVKLTVTDRSGAKSAAECTVVIRDVTRPLITVPGPLTREATSAAGATVPYVATAFDAVDGDLPINTQNFLCEAPSGALFRLGSPTPVLCSARDTAGNSATAQFTVSVVDTTAPVIAASKSLAVEADGPSGRAVTYSVMSTDAVDGEKEAACSPASGSTFRIGAGESPTVTPVTCAATDSSGNIAKPVTFEVAVHDTRAPVFNAATISPDLVKEATSPAGAVAAFALPAARDVVDLDAVTVACSRETGSTFPLGVTPVACDATDSRGNSTANTTPATSATFKVTVQDTTAPVFAGMPQDARLEATSATGAILGYTLPTATDIVDGVRPVTCAPAAGQFALGRTLVDCSASDTRGNTVSAGFSVVVEDTTAPTLLLPGTLRAEATGAGGAAVAFAAFANDVVDGSVVPVCSAKAGDTFAVGTTTVACTATDRAGNASRGSFDVIVADTTAPVIAPQADIRVTATANSSAIVQYALPVATDVVDGTVAVACTPAPGSSFAAGTTAVNCSASDSRGNTAKSSFNVHVAYAFTGFFQPVDNAPAINSVKAGSAVPVKFALGGNQGLAIFQAGSPTSGMVACGSTLEAAIEETVTAGGSSLQYDTTAGHYVYVWKTEKAWLGTCRVLQLKLKDGSSTTAIFKFK